MIQLHIPDDLAAAVQRLIGNPENLIIDFLRSKVRELDTPRSLADEYRMAAAENIKVARDFKHTNMEGRDKGSPIDYFGTLTLEEGDKVQQYRAQSRNEWERDI